MNLQANIQEEIIAFTQELVRLNSLSGQEGAVARLIAAKLGSMDFDEVFVDGYGVEPGRSKAGCEFLV